jgi:hypothetical protein
MAYPLTALSRDSKSARLPKGLRRFSGQSYDYLSSVALSEQVDAQADLSAAEPFWNVATMKVVTAAKTAIRSVLFIDCLPKKT